MLLRKTNLLWLRLRSKLHYSGLLTQVVLAETPMTERVKTDCDFWVCRFCWASLLYIYIYIYLEYFAESYSNLELGLTESFADSKSNSHEWMRFMNKICRAWMILKVGRPGPLTKWLQTHWLFILKIQGPIVWMKRARLKKRIHLCIEWSDKE